VKTDGRVIATNHIQKQVAGLLSRDPMQLKLELAAPNQGIPDVRAELLSWDLAVEWKDECDAGLYPAVLRVVLLANPLYLVDVCEAREYENLLASHGSSSLGRSRPTGKQHSRRI